MCAMLTRFYYVNMREEQRRQAVANWNAWHVHRSQSKMLLNMAKIFAMRSKLKRFAATGVSASSWSVVGWMHACL